MKPTIISSLKTSDVSGVIDLNESKSNEESKKSGSGKNANSGGGGVTIGGEKFNANLSLKAVRIIDCGEQHTIALTVSGHIWTWGSNSEGQLGTSLQDSKKSYDAKPRQLTQTFAVYTIVHIAAGNKHSLAVTDKGDLFTWGCGKHGQLGLGGTTNESEPTIVAALQGHTVIKVAGGEEISAAI